ncbi:unnamed protein product [Amoebophrya sp. A25]|nr:unnamed protein product [Amoebophrya sp. A25]|eukprot:GSA25T00005008001.1
MVDGDVPDIVNLQIPILYQESQLQRGFNWRVFASWILQGVALGAGIRFLCTTSRGTTRRSSCTRSRVIFFFFYRRPL